MSDTHDESLSPAADTAMPEELVVSRRVQHSGPGTYIAFHRRKVGVLLLALSVLIGGISLILWSGVLAGSFRGNVLRVLLPLVLPFLMLLWGTYLYKGIRGLGTGVAVTPDGLIDNTSVVPSVFLPWSKVTDVQELAIGNRRVISLSLESPEVVAGQLPAVLKPVSALASRYMIPTMRNTYTLQAVSLEVPFDTMKTAVLLGFNEYRRRNGLSESLAPYNTAALDALRADRTCSAYMLFTDRALALLLDCTLMFVPVAIVTDVTCWALGGIFGSGMAARAEMVVPMAMWTTYFAVCHSSLWQATIGKRILGLVVTGEDGTSISFQRAMCRYILLTVSLLPLGIGFLMALWTRRKQALHDIIAKTLVVPGPSTK